MRKRTKKKLFRSSIPIFLILFGSYLLRSEIEVLLYGEKADGSGVICGVLNKENFANFTQKPQELKSALVAKKIKD